MWVISIYLFNSRDYSLQRDYFNKDLVNLQSAMALHTPASVLEELIWKEGLFSQSQICFFLFVLRFLMNFFFWNSSTFLKHNICLILVVSGWAPRLHPSRRLVFQLPRIFYFEIFQGSVIAKIWWERGEGDGEGENIRNSPQFKFVSEPKSNSYIWKPW